MKKILLFSFFVFSLFTSRAQMQKTYEMNTFSNVNSIAVNGSVLVMGMNTTNATNYEVWRNSNTRG